MSQLNTITACVEHDVQAVKQMMNQQLVSTVELVNQVCQHIMQNGGKQLRPLVLLLTANALGYKGSKHIQLATILEYIHTATLLHDDVIDESLLRRGLPTANNVWGNSVSVLIGDYLYSCAFQLMAKLNDIQIVTILADATRIISEGEVQQLMNRHNLSITEKDYLRVIEAKTGKLFELAGLFAAVITEQSDTQCKQLAAFGMYLGIAFQLVDDALDYMGSAEELGKNIGDDLADGLATLPFIYSLQTATTEDRLILEAALKQNDINALDSIKLIIDTYQGAQYTLSVARDYAEKARNSLRCLSDSIYKSALMDLIDFTLKRCH